MPHANKALREIVFVVHLCPYHYIAFDCMNCRLLYAHPQQMVSELPAWTRLWCVMRQNTLRCWLYPEDVGRKMPMHTFSFTDVSISYHWKDTMYECMRVKLNCQLM